MDFRNFRVPMLNSLRVGPYDFPFQTNAPTQEWLIASRLENQSAYLTISDTSAAVEPSNGDAPEGLMEQNTIVAVLADETDVQSRFLMLRHLPRGVRISGRFFPADGAATLSRTQGKLRLDAFGRHAHSRGTEGGASVLHDIPNPAPNTEGAINWHFAAEQRPWTPQIQRTKDNEV